MKAGRKEYKLQAIKTLHFTTPEDILPTFILCKILNSYKINGLTYISYMDNNASRRN